MPTVTVRPNAGAIAHTLQNLHLSAYRELPDSHKWTLPPLTTTTHSPNLTSAVVPTIDLLDPHAATKISLACHSHGIFRVTGHGIPTELLSAAEAQCRHLFALPGETKLRAARGPGEMSGYGVARISAFFDKVMWSEGFTVVGSPDGHARMLWPADQGRRFCSVIEEYKEEMRKLAARITCLILDTLAAASNDDDKNQQQHHVVRSYLSGPDAAAGLQLNSYPSCPDPDRAMGLAAHTDSTVVTILHQSTGCTGLQVLQSHYGHDRSWLPVPPMPGALVVNVGDLLHILSNGRFRSAVHRAVVNRHCHRVSLAYLYGLPPHVKVQPFVGRGERPMYPPVTWPEYLGIKAQHFDKALDALRMRQRRVELELTEIETDEQWGE